ncbi:hypothetical protein I7H67_04615 [Acinetobacter sp. ACIN00229]|uniref:hypothetical protein n=1 Tax=Acinetobacter sp. ACIN00229 TaxID=2792607 RepID=UPI0018DFCCAD|nr:hypothetical protein [Acinetobacter sp. ACIN00229]MBI0422083.1 hypothetical protein [Acinetobacter sp. ACIN00229]
MNLQFANNLDFKQYLQAKKTDIVRRTDSAIQETDQFKSLYAALNSYLISRAFLDIKTLLISKESLLILRDDFYPLLEEVLDSDQSAHNNYLVINENIEISYMARQKDLICSNDARRTYERISTEGYIVFVLQPDALINYYIDGEDYGEGIFLTNYDYNRYKRLKSTSDLSNLFDEYRERLKLRDIYNKFFISRSHLKSLHKKIDPDITEDNFMQLYKNILNNKPEDRLREDLRFFLENELQTRLIKKELILNNFRRLDIFIWDESGTEMFLIEVKWVGTSIHSNGEKIGTSYKDTDICPNAIHQSIDYLRQLHVEKHNIKLGYLVVFDARLENLPDTGTNINDIVISSENIKHFSKFRKVPDFRIDNIHPS